ncbi:MAG TPA: transglycosylase SLT domain-containing protein [Vicinamibacterales bacterium]
MLKSNKLFAVTLGAALLMPAASMRAQAPAAPAAGDLVLKPTNHPRLPVDPSDVWLVPTKIAPRTAVINEFVTAVKLEVDSNFAKALPILSQSAIQEGVLGHYAAYYQGLAELRLGRPADARRTFQSLAARHPIGYLAEAVALREAECAEAGGDQSAAMEIYARLAATKNTAPDDVLMRLGRAARAAGDLDRATDAFQRVVYEFPFSDLALVASNELETLPLAPIAPGSTRYKLELGRAERLFGAKRYPQAKQAFEAVRGASQGDDRELVNIRLAECDFFLKHARNTRDALKPYIENASRKGEALYFYAVAIRELGDQAEYFRIIRRLADEFTSQSWAEEALNNLATHYILQSDDDNADATFREMIAKFPMGHYAERASWKVGWNAYRRGRYAEAIQVFEPAAMHFPRSDYRPSWLYWSARAYESLNQPALADARYTLVTTDYLNSYYGRLSLTHLDGRAPQRRLVTNVQAPPQAAPPDPSVEEPPIVAPLPPNQQVVRALLSIELWDQALDELHYAQKAWGDSSAIQATIGWIYHKRGELRAGINQIKRAYPQYMAAGGEELPSDLLKVLFPVDYWALIRRYSAEHQLDPYMMAALIAQESNFVPDVRSPANAYGLMQLVPAAGRQYAKTLNRRYSLSLLTTADSNLRMGTAYFADLVEKFGGAHYALASYNAGPARVAHWMAERPGMDRDMFIDDIPFPETQAYVKKIIGTAEDYRRLYGPDGSAGDTVPATTQPAASDAAAKKKAAPPAKKKTAAKSKKAA